jgi:hypothetical protein
MWTLLAACVVSAFDDPTKEPPAPVEVVDTDLPDGFVGDTAPPVDTAAGDADLDGVQDRTDNCVDVPNPDQDDLDGDDLGDACDDERDGDGIPDVADLFPDDVDRPGVASPDTVYAHGPNELYALNVVTGRVSYLAAFSFNQRGDSVTDIAIDRYGVLYAVTFYDAFVCHPQDARCWHIGALPDSYNGLTFVPPAVVGTTERLVGITVSGTWTQYNGVPFALNPSPLGGYGGASSSGDAFYIEGVGCYAAVEGLSTWTSIVETSTSGSILRTVATLDGYSGVYGIAGWSGTIYVFAANGDVLQIDTTSGARTLIADAPGSWWGAGVRTRIGP